MNKNKVKIYEAEEFNSTNVIKGQIFELARYTAVFIVKQYAFLEENNRIPTIRIKPETLKFIEEVELETSHSIK